MADGAGATAPMRVVEKEMAISHADFRRVLTRLDGAIEGEGARLAVVDGGRRLEITLSPERRRTIGLFDLPVTDVRLAFVGYDEAGAEAMLRRFDRAFQRGGG